MLAFLSGILDNPIVRILVAVGVATVFFNIVLLFLPVSSLPEEILDGFTWVISGLYAFDFLIPVETMITALTLLFTADILFTTIHLLMWFKKHLTQQH